jgi:CHAT domain-containing protein
LAPDDAEKSFLLLGDGNRLSLKTIDDAPEYAFTGVELLTLSSCNTGVNWNDAGYGSNGNEVENFGLIAQNRGAKAVIATLWSVADDSTSVLMREFYRIRSTTSGITKAEALQRAQLALLHGDPAGISRGPHVSRADLVGSPAQNPNEQSRSARPGKPYAHPYYWAPFILIGNWH